MKFKKSTTPTGDLIDPVLSIVKSPDDKQVFNFVSEYDLYIPSGDARQFKLSSEITMPRDELGIISNIPGEPLCILPILLKPGATHKPIISLQNYTRGQINVKRGVAFGQLYAVPVRMSKDKDEKDNS